MKNKLRFLTVAGLLLGLLSLPLSVGTVRATRLNAARSATSALTVGEIYRRTQQSLSQVGMLYHAIVQGSTQSGPIRTTSHTELWVDGRRNVTRETLRGTYTVRDPRTGQSNATQFNQTTITTTQGAYTRSSPPPQLDARKPPLCYGSGLLAANVVLGCPGPTTTENTSVVSGRYSGRPVVILLSKGTESGEDQNRIFTSRLYLDPTTFLPVASVTTGTLDAGKKYPLHEAATYGYAFVPTSRVTANFFNPTSIGYNGPESTINQELAPVPASFALYWLGVRFHAPTGWPDLVANRAVPSPSGGSSASVELYYTSAEDPYCFPVLFIEETVPDPARMMHPPSGPCIAREKVQLSGGNAVISAGTRPAGKTCSTRFPAMALVSFSQTSIVIQAPTCCTSGRTSVENPYNSLAGMELVVRALQRRIPPRWRSGATASSTRAQEQEAQRPLTVRQLYQQIEARLAQTGKIYRAVIGSTKVWVDARRDLARVQSTGRLTSGQSYSYTIIYANGTTYTRGSGSVRAPGQPAVQTRPVFTCQGAHIAASVILGCPNPAQAWTMSLQPGQYASRPVLVLLRKGTDHSEGNPDILTAYTTRIYLDRQTLLPLTAVITGITSTKKPVHGTVTYMTSLVDPSSLPASFFQPASIGYQGRADEIRQEMKPVPADFTVLWLGLDFAGGQGLPALSLQQVVTIGGGTNFDIQLSYAPAKNLWGTPFLSVEERSSAAPVGLSTPPTGSGWTRQTVKLANGHAVIVSGRSIMAFAYIGSTSALIEPVGSAFSSVPALQTIVRALRPYVPDR